MSRPHPNGAWIVTATGRVIYPGRMLPEDVCIEDIAHALARTQRYGGHASKNISVAEHSVHVADWLYNKTACEALALAGLLHDAGEAYLCDIPKPWKQAYPDFRYRYEALEYQMLVQVSAALGVDLDLMRSDELQEADRRICADEMRACLPAFPEDLEPLGIELHHWNECEAEREFLRRFEELAQERRKSA